MAIIGIALWALIPGFIAKKKGRNFWGYYFLSFLISPLITMIIAICVSKKCEENDIEENENSFDETANWEFCKKCGADVSKDTRFCHVCGESISNIES